MSVISNNQLAGAAGQGGADAYQISRSLRFNSGDSAHLSRTPSVGGDRRVWTYSVWVKRHKLGTEQQILRANVGTNAQNTTDILFYNDQLWVYTTSGGSDLLVKKTTQVFRDPSAWLHIVVSCNSPAVTIYVNGDEVTDFSVNTVPASAVDYFINHTTSHLIGRNLSNGSVYADFSLADAQLIDGQALAPTDFGEYDDNNVWQAKEYTGTYGANGFHLPFSDNSINAALGYDAAVEAPTVNPDGGFDVVTYTGNGSTQSISSLAFQPDFVWIKRRNSTNNHRIFDTIRGVNKSLSSDLTSTANTSDNQLTAFNPGGFALGSNNEVNQNTGTYVAWCWRAGGTPSSNTDGSITSQVSASTDYGFSICTYTGNGSGTANSDSGDSFGHGLSSAPKFILVKRRNSANGWPVYHASTALGALSLNGTNALDTGSYLFAQQHPSSSVVYLGNNPEINATGSTYVAYCWSEVAGFSKFSSYSGNGSNTGTVVTTGFKPRFVLIKGTSSARDWWIYDSQRDPSNPNMARLSPNSSSAEATNVYAIDFLDNGFQLKTSDVALNGSGETYIYAAFADRPGNNWDVNNLVAKAAGLETANQGFDVVTYTGNGSTQSITGLNFQPDFVWTSVRDATGYNKYLIDSVRGSTKVLISHKTDAESTQSTGITSFNSDGFSVGSNAQVNENGRSMVAWCWKAGGAASSNTDGTIASQVSANTTYGFSIVTYSGTLSNTPNPAPTVGHGLNAAPQLIISKSRNPNGDDNGAWYVNHTYNYDYWLRLNLTNAEQSIAASGGGTTVDPTSSVFSTYFIAGSNCNNNNYVAYCWSEVPGFSKFGSYTGTGATGHKITTGFKPAWILFRRTDSVSNWRIVDRLRGTASLNAETNEAEQTLNFAINDDGFTINETGNNPNASGGSYIYAAFADKPPGEIIDSLIDTPTNYDDGTNVGGNYCTLNPLAQLGGTLSNGNLDYNLGSGTKFASGTLAVKSGKFHWEAKAVSGTTNGSVGGRFGFSQSSSILHGEQGPFTLVWHSTQGLQTFISGSYAVRLTGTNYADGDTLGCALDADSNIAYFYKNGSLAYTYDFSSLVSAGSQFLTPTCWNGSSGTPVWTYNFGQRPFAYTPPTGFKTLCTTNLDDPTIADGSTAFDTKLYTSETSISGLSFSPDLVWLKRRSQSADHGVYDTVRGPSKLLYPSVTNSEETTAGVNQFNSDGFDLGTNGLFTGGGHSFVSWNWDAGSSTVSNTDGSITSNVRANPSAGFSIVTYNGTGSNATFGHGLNAAPELVIVKSRSHAQNWAVQHSALGPTYYGYLQSTNAFSTTSGGPFWNNTAPTSSVVNVGTDNDTNASGKTYVAYCFAPVEGYSAFGSYTGNGASDGPFVYTGFRPRWLLLRCSSLSQLWLVLDSARDEYNIMSKAIQAHVSDAEIDNATNYGVDFTSNGFKIRSSTDRTNGSGQTYIYAAFAEHPFKTARAR